jgi:uncharacterized protein YqeY
MLLSDQVNAAILQAMKAKDNVSLRALRAIKSALLLAQSEKAGTVVEEAQAQQLLQKLAKQRKDAMEIFAAQNRQDLYTKEAEELAVIQRFLPEQLDQQALQQALLPLVEGASAADFSKLMPQAMAALKGKADNKTIAETLKKMLS